MLNRSEGEVDWRRPFTDKLPYRVILAPVSFQVPESLFRRFSELDASSKEFFLSYLQSMSIWRMHRLCRTPRRRTSHRAPRHTSCQDGAKELTFSGPTSWSWTSLTKGTNRRAEPEKKNLPGLPQPGWCTTRLCRSIVSRRPRAEPSDRGPGRRGPSSLVLDDQAG
jgi:hypothetical protein